MTFSRRSLFGMALASVGWRWWPAPMMTPIIVKRIAPTPLSASHITFCADLQRRYDQWPLERMRAAAALDEEE